MVHRKKEKNMNHKNFIVFLVLSLISCDLFAPNPPVFRRSQSSGQVSSGASKIGESLGKLPRSKSTSSLEIDGIKENRDVNASKGLELNSSEGGVGLGAKPISMRSRFFSVFQRASGEAAKPQNQTSKGVFSSFTSSLRDCLKISESDPSVSQGSRFAHAFGKAAEITSRAYGSAKGATGTAVARIKALASLLNRLTFGQKEKLAREIQSVPENVEALKLLESRIRELDAENMALRNQLKKQSGLQLTEPQVAKLQDKLVDIVNPEPLKDSTPQSKFSPERIQLNEVLQSLESKLMELQNDGDPGQVRVMQGKINVAYKNIIDVMTSGEWQAELTMQQARKNELQPRVDKLNALNAESAQLNKAVIAIKKKIKESQNNGDQSVVDQLTSTLNQHNTRQKEIRNEVAVLKKDGESLALIDQRITQVQEKLGGQSEELASSGLLSQIGAGSKLNAVTVDASQKNMQPESLKSNNNPITQEAINKLTGDVLAPAALAKLQLSKISLFEAQGKKILSDSLVSKEIKNVVEKNMELLQGRRTELQAAPAEQFNVSRSNRFEGRGLSGAPILKGAAPQEQVTQKEVVSYVFKNPIEQIAAQRKFQLAAENAVQVEVSANIMAKKAEIEATAVAKFEALSPKLKEEFKDAHKDIVTHKNFEALMTKRLQEQKNVMIQQELKNQDSEIIAMEKAGREAVDKAGQEAVARFKLEVDAARKNEPMKTSEQRSNKAKKMTREESEAEQAQIAQIKKNVEAVFEADKSVWIDSYEIDNIKATSKDIQKAVDKHVALLKKDAVAKWREEGKQPVQPSQKVEVFDPVAIDKVNHDLGQLKSNAIADAPELLAAKEALLKDYRSRDRGSMKSKDVRKLDSAIAALKDNIANLKNDIVQAGDRLTGTVLTPVSFGNVTLRSRTQVDNQLSVQEAGSTPLFKLKSVGESVPMNAVDGAVSNKPSFKLRSVKDRVQNVDQSSGSVAANGSAPVVSRLRKVDRSDVGNAVDGMVRNKPEFANVKLRSLSNNVSSVTQNMNQVSDVMVGN